MPLSAEIFSISWHIIHGKIRIQSWKIHHQLDVENGAKCTVRKRYDIIMIVVCLLAGPRPLFETSRLNRFNHKILMHIAQPTNSIQMNLI